MGASRTRSFSGSARMRRSAETIAKVALTLAFVAFCLLALRPSSAFAASAQTAISAMQPLHFVQDSGDELDCVDFDFQEEAQEVLDADPGDPHALDPNRDGIACALLPPRGSSADADIEIAQEADPEAERAARQAEREERRSAGAQEGDDASGDVVSVTCANFATQEDAQAAFDLDPAGLASLDPDGNAIACEELVADVTAADASGADETREERQNRRNQEQGGNQQGNETIDQPVVDAVREDLDCIDFQFQEEAQSILDRDLSDPFNLDPNGDGFACSSLPSATPQIVQVPRTGVGVSSAWPMLEYGSLAIFAGMALISAGLFRHSRRTEDSPGH